MDTKKRFRLLGIVTLVMVCLALAGCNLFGSEEISDPPNDDQPMANLLENPGFEQLDGEEALNWTATTGGWGGGTVSATSEAARTGNVGVKIAGKAAWIYQTIPVEPGEEYELTAWAKGSGNAAFKLEYVCPDGDGTKTCVEEPQGFTPSQEWQQFSFSTTASSEVMSVRIMLRLTSGEGTYVYYDDVSFRKVD